MVRNGRTARHFQKGKLTSNTSSIYYYVAGQCTNELSAPPEVRVVLVTARACRSDHLSHSNLVAITLVHVQKKCKGHGPFSTEESCSARHLIEPLVITHGTVGILVTVLVVVDNCHVLLALISYSLATVVRCTRRYDV